MINKSKTIKNILFLDVETVSITQTYADLPEKLKPHWIKKCTHTFWNVDTDIAQDDRIESLFYKKAGIYAEFAKIVCISVGYTKMKSDGTIGIRLKSYYGEDEPELLLAFKKLLSDYFYDSKSHYLCGHNLREFDIPFICRRMIINGISLPAILDVGGKKPWQTPQFLDTLEMWKFGDYKNYTSLDLLTAVFGIESPKDDMDGSIVSKVYYEEKNLKRIVEYCEKDVISVAQLYMKYHQLPLIDKKNIRSKSNLNRKEEEE